MHTNVFYNLNESQEKCPRVNKEMEWNNGIIVKTVRSDLFSIAQISLLAQ